MLVYNVRLGILGKLLRFVSYLCSTLLCLALMGIALVVLLSDSGDSFSLGMVPWWTGRQLARILLLAGFAGLIATLLAIIGRLRFLMVLWTLAVLGTLICGYFLSGYTYEDMAEFRFSIYLVGAALLAFIAAVTGLFGKRERRWER